VVNKVILLGYLRKDPILYHTPNGTPYTLLTVVVERKWRNSEGQEHVETDQHIVHVWRKLAEACAEYLSRSRLVYIEGRLHSREWTDEQQVTHQHIEVIAELVKFMPHFHPHAHRTAETND
jgi:single-strand DNA-binding protein